MKDKYKQEREQMVYNQLKSRGIKDDKIISAFLEVPRENFLSNDNKKYAYYDSAMPIGYSQTISQPYIVALMSEMLRLKEDDIVLEVGSGSGYQSAIIAKIAKKVVSYEIVEELSKFARENLKKSGINNVEVIYGDPAQKIKEKGVFDKCIITAATKKVPSNIIESMKENALIVVPEGDSLELQILKIYQITSNKLELKYEGIPVRFVPLKGKNQFQ